MGQVLDGNEHTLDEYLIALDESIAIYPNRHIRELRDGLHFALRELRSKR